ncbi:hypothetical protein VCR15J2_470518 [Vibrio coralliirubri]|uniref:hypothetical protein n=1 Tax=Vibrio coralliirubri TaxID=1516159 RepID=UPI000639BE06|nr:hypothetical protein [Vibrio coralliirubri]CDT67766.1 hypothetical protein VCR15J2_470518 [Vibrio coralliirubri]
MTYLLIATLAITSQQTLSTVKLNWYGVVPAIINKAEFTQFHLTYEICPDYQVKLVKLDI